jgi:hypothetical protein
MARHGAARSGEAGPGSARLGKAWGRTATTEKEQEMGNLFIGGKDTKPEIDAIMAAVQARVGTSIRHEEVAKIAGLDANSQRFRTVTQRWRRMIERDTATRIESRERVFYFLTADEAHDRSKVDLHRIGRASGKLVARVSAIDATALTGERKDAHFILARETAALLDSARRSAKAIQAPKAVRPANLRIAK